MCTCTVFITLKVYAQLYFREVVWSKRFDVSENMLTRNLKFQSFFFK